MSNELSDERLAELYRRLMERRQDRPAGSAPPLETIQALAAGSYRGGDRITLLETVLANPSLAAEFQMFRELLAEARPQARARRAAPQIWALAAGLAVLSVASLVWLSLRRGPEREPLRGSNRAPVLLAPAAGASIRAGDRLLWHAVVGAAEYTVQVEDSDGALIFSKSLTNTMTTLPDTLRLVASGRYLWWVEVRHADGTTSRAVPVPVRGAVP